jgi:nucleoside-diphosphate-sugar epimerase/lipopolysaccharide/colanic/teichoic acid biosynthesis glycosyltransferase
MILVTGANGFIGKALTQALLDSGQSVLAAVRDLSSLSQLEHAQLKYHAVGNINNQTQWQQLFHCVHSIVHCAARAHVTSEHAVDALSAYREVNVRGTMHLAQQAAAAGVRRFVFISSIGVNGNQSDQPFTETCQPNPRDAYSVSKLEAELALLDLAANTGMEVCIVRPPLVYGPSAPGNFANLMHWVDSGLPLPLGAVHNRRSLVAVDNLVSLILLCADRERSPQAANQVFVVADGDDVSITTLLCKVARASRRPSRLLPVPNWLLFAGASMLGKHTEAQRLLGDLQVDATKARNLLGWRPVINMDQQLTKIFTVKHSTSTFSQSRSLLRLLDMLIASAGLVLLWPLLLLIFFVSWFDTRSPLFMQERVGRQQRPFVLFKFRTMRLGTASVATHLAPIASITPMGAFLRRTKLDELPQLWNVLRGDMSLVGPRPGLFNQHQLTAARAALGVYAARPGITGLAQVNGIDMSTPELLAKTDVHMMHELGVINYFKFIILTVTGKGSGDRVKNT